MNDTVYSLFGFAGAIVGALGAIAVNAFFLNHYFTERNRKELDEPRRKLLADTLNHPTYKWRKISTLQRVIGADDETTKRLLLDIGARGSEKDDGLWG
ncbi:MAG: hypothetical protein EAZ92_03000 [Candidatus Kapaibacterium sp.]|nr:MAG: hypothetical protein EAZ92_03000 [Candidatus Kapabacteria bacterium]